MIGAGAILQSLGPAGLTSELLQDLYFEYRVLDVSAFETIFIDSAESWFETLLTR